MPKSKRHQYGLAALHRLTPAEYAEQLVRQGGVCAICKADPATLSRMLAVDHDHVTGAFRGLLCINCNTGLGKFGDDPALLRAAAEYLEAA
jgi:hypothetical protein